MTGQRRLEGHLGSLQVADLTDHDDVRVLAQQGAGAFGKAQVYGRMDLQLVEPGFNHFDRVFDGTQVDLRCGQVLEGCVQSAGLAGPGRTCDQDQAVALPDQRLPAQQVVILQP
ncbi:hypothetical protein D3C80_934100 [compost metagenome]